MEKKIKIAIFSKSTEENEILKKFSNYQNYNVDYYFFDKEKTNSEGYSLNYILLKLVFKDNININYFNHQDNVYVSSFQKTLRNENYDYVIVNGIENSFIFDLFNMKSKKLLYVDKELLNNKIYPTHDLNKTFKYVSTFIYTTKDVYTKLDRLVINKNKEIICIDDFKM